MLRRQCSPRDCAGARLEFSSRQDGALLHMPEIGESGQLFFCRSLLHCIDFTENLRICFACCLNCITIKACCYFRPVQTGPLHWQTANRPALDSKNPSPKSCRRTVSSYRFHQPHGGHDERDQATHGQQPSHAGPPCGGSVRRSEAIRRERFVNWS